MPSKRALETNRNVLSTKRELPTLDFAFYQVYSLPNIIPIEIFFFFLFWHYDNFHNAHIPNH